MNNSGEFLKYNFRLGNPLKSKPYYTDLLTAGAVKKRERMGDKSRGRKTVRRRKQWHFRQTVWLQRDLQHSASYDSGVRGYPHWWISSWASSSSQKRGSCFHSPGLESLFQEFILPVQIVNLSKGRRLPRAHILLFKKVYQPAKTVFFFSSFKCFCGCNHTQKNVAQVCITCETYIHGILTGFGRLQFADCELCES